ncbi:MAG: glutamine-hydrolyzing GMP synthase [Mycoplasmatales bacterium]
MEKVLVIDFGSQYNQLIVRRIRELGVYAELINPNFKLAKLQEMIAKQELKGLILSGGPDVITEEGSLKCDEGIFELNIPILGICYGMQYLATYYQNSVVPGKIKEYGLGEITLSQENELLVGLDQQETVWMSHGYHVELVNSQLIELAKSQNNILAVVKHQTKQQYGVQFHPEVTDTINGQKILSNFLQICQVKREWSMTNYIDFLITNIQKKVGDEQVILGLSGGVDSTVVAALLAQAIPGQVTCILVDHGLLRHNEVEEVLTLLQDLPLKIIVANVQEKFLQALKGIVEPEQKRKIIGKLFIETFDEEKIKLKNTKFLAQGTLYTDIIESGTAQAQTIKSHHNVGGLPQDLEFELLEPLKWLFKDEVRKLGLELGLNHDVVYRQPFPGPGLAIRIIGSVTEEKIKIVAQSDYILRTKIKDYGLDKKIWQYFTVLTNMKTVGVKGDERSYDYVLAIRAISSIDGMTAKYYEIDYKILTEISTQITNEVPHIGRVVYDITSKPPATIEWE